LYQPTHRHGPSNQQDPIRYRNLVKRLEESVRAGGEYRSLAGVFERLEGLTDVKSFWDHQADGLAILASPAVFEIFQLQIPVPELAIVADSFHIKPLIRATQTGERYQVLCLDRTKAMLHEGNRYALDPIDLPDAFPKTIEQALGSELTEPYSAVAPPASGVLGAVRHHGTGTKSDELDLDTEKFFRAVDRAVLEGFSKPSGLPLVLVALSEYQTPFRRLSRNGQLLEPGVAVDPSSLDREALRGRVWEVLEPLFRRRAEEEIERFREAVSHRQGSAILADVARAAAAGRVDRLMVDADLHVAGRIDPASGALQLGELVNPEIDDAIDDLAELTMRQGGQVIVLPRTLMPTESGIAGIYRY
jgi:hypothetical protein